VTYASEDIATYFTGKLVLCI